MFKRIRMTLLVVGLCAALTGCQGKQTALSGERSDFASATTAPTETASPATDAAAIEATTEPAATAETTPTAEPTETAAPTETASPEITVSPTEAAGEDEIAVLSFSDMYTGENSSRGLHFSERFSSMDGKTVQLSGYMAPPLKPAFNFFVLTREPMSMCPFCSTDADWPADIVLIYLGESMKSVANDTLLTVTGRLELGSYTDPDTGFVSQARIYAEEIKANR